MNLENDTEYAQAFLVPAVLDDDSDDFGMYTSGGNKAVKALLRATADLVLAGCAEHDATAFLAAGKQALVGAGHSEVHDSVVAESLVWMLRDLWEHRYGHSPGADVRWSPDVQVAGWFDRVPAVVFPERDEGARQGPSTDSLGTPTAPTAERGRRDQRT